MHQCQNCDNVWPLLFARADVPKPATMAAAVPAQSLNPGLLDAAFSPAPLTNTPAQAVSQNMFDEAFGAPSASAFGAPLLPMVRKSHT